MFIAEYQSTTQTASSVPRIRTLITSNKDFNYQPIPIYTTNIVPDLRYPRQYQPIIA